MSGTIKIFVDAHCFDTVFQGTQTFLRELYTELLKKYPDLDIYFGAYYPERIRKAFPYLDPQKILRYKRLKPSLLRLLADIPSYLKKHRFDYAHFQNIACRHNSICRHIVTLHDVLYNDYPREFPVMYRKFRNILFKKSIREADMKTTVSAYSSNRIAHYYHIPEEQMHLIANGVKVQRKNIRQFTEDARKHLQMKYGIGNYILSVSRAEPRKNHEMLLRVWLDLRLHLKNLQLVFIGNGSNKWGARQQHLLGSDMKNFIRLFDQVDPSELDRFYAASRIFVFPSKAEGFGLPPLEAAMYEVPVLCSNTTAMKDFTFFHPNLFDPSDENDLRHKLTKMIDNPPSGDFLHTVADNIAKRYSWEKSADDFYKLLQLNKTS